MSRSMRSRVKVLLAFLAGAAVLQLCLCGQCGRSTRIMCSTTASTMDTSVAKKTSLNRSQPNFVGSTIPGIVRSSKLVAVKQWLSSTME